MARASRRKADDDTAPEQPKGELRRYGDRALKVAEWTAAATTGVIVVATAGAFLGTIIVTKSPKAAAIAAGKVLNFTTKHYKTIAGSAAVASGAFIREGADSASYLAFNRRLPETSKGG